MSSPTADSLSRIALPLAAARDTAALEAEVLALFDANATPLTRYVRGCGLRPDAADDVVQETFIALFDHLRLGRPRDNLQGWLFTVAHRQAQKHLTRMSRQRAIESPIETGTVDLDPAAAGDPETLLVRRQTQRRLASVFRALPARHRHCLLLRVEGLRYREIADVLNISLGGVAKALAHALLRLSHVVED